MLSSLAVKKRALDLGFDLVGIAPIASGKDLEFSRKWAEKGFNGEMRYLGNPKRFDPRLVLPSAHSAICVGLVYNVPLPYSTEVGSCFRNQESEVRSQDGAANQESRDIARNVAAGPESSVTANAGQQRKDDKRFSSFHFPVSIFQSAPRAWISRYAWGHDYHEIMRAKLEQLRSAVEGLAPGVETRVFVDTGPVIERALARFSGIGWMGKNTCIINQEKGSWFFLGLMLISLELAPDLPAPDRCGSCTACLDACPTGALVEPYVMDASRCISYFTIELRGSIPEQFRPKIGANIFGCDICQDVCPWNSSRPWANSDQPRLSTSQQSADEHCFTQAATTRIPQFYPMMAEPMHPAVGDGGVQLPTDHGQRTTESVNLSLFNPPLEALALLSEDDFRRIFAHSPIKRAKHRGWLRNLCVTMGNSNDEMFVPWLERAAQHSDSVVREHAVWALERLRGK
jgi:epoxyqueuosine reductase